MVNYIGMDAHSETSTFVVLNGNGKVVKKEQILTTEEKIVGFIRGLKGRKELVVEELHLSQWLYGFLVDEVDHLVICSPIHLPKKRGPKNDLEDALNLAKYLKAGDILVSVYHDVSPEMELRVLVSGYGQVTRSLVKVKNMLNAILKRQAIITGRSQRVYKSTKISDLFDNPHKKYVWNDLQQQLIFLTERKKYYMEIFRGNLKLIKGVRLLHSIPGIGDVFANQLMAAIVTPERFSNKYKFFSYCKIVKYIDVSDGKIYGRRNSFGRSDLKSIFETATMMAIKGSSAIAEYHDYHLALGKPRKAARNAVRRKLASIALAVLKSGCPYNDEKLREEIKKKQNTLNIQISK